ncbi:MAG: hypothetical protein LKJ83_10300 [Eubacteriaceae bacterium]|jgi:hypothetical protein|nr:hypothetical protein [Eubacteriaceae bacterium]
MENNKFADTNAIANLAAGLGILSLCPYLYGMTDSSAGCIPWMIGALIFVIIAVIGCLVRGEEVPATANAILTGICLFANLWRSIVITAFGASGVPDNVMTSLIMGDGMASLGASLFCLTVCIIFLKVNKIMSIAIAFPTAAFFLLFLVELGITGPLGVIPQTGFAIFAVWLVYSGCAMLFHHASGHQVLPYILAQPESTHCAAPITETN